MNFRISAFVVAVSVASSAAFGMTMNPRGTGQVLIYPYFTVNAHQQTLLAVTNTTPRGKAVHLRFREGYNGREILGVNIFLSAFDTWAAAVFALDDAGLPGTGAAVLVADHSCTLPSFVTSPKMPDGNSYQPFSNDLYTGAHSDTGPTTDDRTREGFFEIIEMAEVTGPSLASISPANGQPADCAAFQTDPPATDLAPPGGGLVGTEAVVNVTRGTFFSFDATAIDGFANQSIYVPSALNEHPNLADASIAANGFVSAYVPINGGILQLDYPPEQAIDAVSALLTADYVYANWDVTSAAGAQTDWVVTLPTKHFYVDPLIIGSGSSIPPFPSVFGDHQFSSTPFACTLFDRDGVQVTNPIFDPRPVCNGNLPYETQILSFSPTLSSPPASSAVLGSQLNSSLLLNAALYTSGHDVGIAQLDFATEKYALETSANGFILRGLPAIGFEAVNYVNANVTAGVLANYSGAYPLRASASCVAQGASVPNPVCEP